MPSSAPVQQEKHSREDLAHVNPMEAEKPQEHVQQPGDALIHASAVITAVGVCRH